MLYVKYIYPTGQEHISGPYEMVTAEWVDPQNQHIDANAPPNPAPVPLPKRYQVVYCYSKIALGESDIEPGQCKGATMTFGPNIPYVPSAEEIVRYEGACGLAGQGKGEMPPPLPPSDPYPGKVYVMTEAGGTVAKYVL